MSHKSEKIYAAGELLVTGHGEVVIDEVVPKSRALLVHPTQFIHVKFDPQEQLPPPCAGDVSPDEVHWDLFLLPMNHGGGGHHGHHGTEEELRLKIKWKVQTARTILWEIHVPV